MPDNTVSPEFRRAIEDNCDKPFELRTDTEKEELYEKIAEQLAMIADSYDFNSKFASGPAGPPPSKTASLFAPTPAATPATRVVSPAGDDDVFSSSVDPQPVDQGSGANGDLAPPEVVVEPGSPHSGSGAQDPAVEGAVGGITTTQADANLLSPTPSCKYSIFAHVSVHRLLIFKMLKSYNYWHIVNVSFRNTCI